MNLSTYQRELQKRLAVPYIWPRRQNNTDDRATDFIYRCLTFDQAHAQSVQQFGTATTGYYYAMNRWFNFTSAKAVEAIFGQHPRVTTEPNPYHKTIDFRIDGIPFDHKTTVWPRGYPGDFDGAIQHPQPLLAWLYANQSTDRRYHTSNRLFLVLYRDDGDHWKLKANIGLMAACIEEYLEHFTPDDLFSVPVGSAVAQAGVIWITER